MPKLKVTFGEDKIKQIRTLAGILTIEQIADFYGIGLATFNRIRERQPEIGTAYRQGRAELLVKMASSLIKDALNGDKSSRIFYLKTQGGWSENTHIEVDREKEQTSGVLVIPQAAETIAQWQAIATKGEKK